MLYRNIFLSLILLLLLSNCRVRNPYLEMAWIDFNNENYDSGIKEARTACKQVFWKSEAWFILGKYYGIYDKMDSMIYAFDKSINIGPHYDSDIEEIKEYYFNEHFNNALAEWKIFKTSDDTTNLDSKYLKSSHHYINQAVITLPKKRGIYFQSKFDSYIMDRVLSKISDIKDMPYYPEYSGDSLYWEIVKYGKIILPGLIDLLNDSSSTNIGVPLFGGKYTIADISFRIFSDIIHGVPLRKLLFETEFQNTEEGFNYYWEFVRLKHENRIFLKVQVQKWYTENETNLIWQTDTKTFIGGTHNFPRQHPAGGYYVLNQSGS